MRRQFTICNGCHDLTMLSINMSDIAIIFVKNVDYCCTIHNINKSQAINLLENSVLENCWYLKKILSDFWLGILNLENANHLKKLN